MPKRRLGYGEIVLENDSQASSRRRRGSNGGTENPKRPTTRRSSEILLGLSHSCKKHAEYHKDRKNITLHEEENHLPARCKSDLQALRNLLPKVEKTFQPPTKGKVGPAASDVALLCEFYGSILGGTFCPHAPHLFHLGKSTTEVFDRVRFLFRHSVSPTVVTAIRDDRSKDTNPESSDSDVLNTLSTTIAQLLTFLRDFAIFPHIFSDLLNLLDDCNAILEGKLFPVKLNLFDITAHHSKTKCNFAVDLRSVDELISLQSVGLMCMDSFVNQLKAKRLEAQTELTISQASLNGRLLSGSVDLVYWDFLLSQENEAVLLGILRCILESKTLGKQHDNHWWRRRAMALNVMQSFLLDGRNAPRSPQVRIRAALVVARATQNALSVRARVTREYFDTLGSCLNISTLGLLDFHSQLSRDAAPVLFCLLDCIKLIEQTDHRLRTSFDCHIIATIHWLFQKIDEGGLSTISFVSYLTTTGMISNLVNLLLDRHMVARCSSLLTLVISKSTSTRKLDSLFNIGHTTGSQGDAAGDKAVNPGPPVNQRKLRSGTTKRVPQSPIQPLLLSPTRGTAEARLQETVTSSINRLSTAGVWGNVLRAAVKLAKKYRDLDPNSHMDQNAAVISTSEPDIAYILGVLHVISAVIGDRCDSSAAILKQRHMLALWNQLLDSICPIATYLAEIGRGNYNKAEMAIAERVLDFTLFVHFSIGKLFEASEGSVFAGVTRLINCGTRISASYLHLRLNSKGDRHGPASNSISSDAESMTFAVTTHPHRDATKYPCCHWDNDCFRQTSEHCISLDMIMSLRFQERCLLLSSLYPKLLRWPHPGAADTLNIESLMSSDKLISIIQRGEESQPNLMELAEAALFVSPILISSWAYLDRFTNETRADSYLQDSLKDSWLPFLLKYEIQRNEICRALLSAWSRIQLCARSPDISKDRYNPCFLVHLCQGIETADISEGNPQTMSLELRSIMQEVLRALVRKIPEDHVDSLVRRLRWNCLMSSVIGWSANELREICGSSKEKQKSGSGSQERPWTHWLLEAPFTDHDRSFRISASRNLHKVILVEDGNFLLAHFSSSADFKTLTTESDTLESDNATQRMVSDFFQEIDRLLGVSIGLPESQLSFTMVNSSSGDSKKTNSNATEPGTRLSMQRCASRILATMCQAQAPIRNTTQLMIFEKAYQRLSRLWAASNFDKSVESLFPSLVSCSSSKALAFSELLCVTANFGDRVQSSRLSSSSFFPTVVGDNFVLSCNVGRMAQFSQLESFLQQTCLSESTKQPLFYSTASAKGISELLEDSLPALLAQFIGERDAELLRLTTAFRLYLSETIRIRHSKRDPHSHLVGTSNSPTRLRLSSVSIDGAELDKQTKAVCLSPGIIEKILPLIFMNADRSALSFFKTDVLRGMALNEIMKHRELLILKGLAWELGRDPKRIGPARQAIRTAAAARILDQREKSEKLDSTVGKQWVTSQFMFLLVNVVQARWRSRQLKDRLQAVRCLSVLIDFLAASEASQYFPQIMATVNAAVIDGSVENLNVDKDAHTALSLRLDGVKVLSKYVRLVVEHQVEAIAPKLTMVVVSLIPVLEDVPPITASSKESIQAKDTAVALLEYLTLGGHGRILAKFFSNIPFLPSSPELERVHRELQSNGVDFDNLVISSTGTQGFEGKDTSGVDLSGPISGHSLQNTTSIRALKKRLNLVCLLLDNESSSVRKVVLNHLTGLLRGNRQLFHALIRSEEIYSRRKFLTIAQLDTNGNPKWTAKGAVTTMVEKLLARCVVESRPEVRLQLATCLGEMGALCETKLGELKVGTSMGEGGIDSPSSSYTWRLEQAPWNSISVLYQLELVRKHLAVALNAASSSTDQNKIAFSIQQLLKLLDNYGCRKESSNKSNPGPNQAIKSMSAWLKEKLEKNGVFDAVEPYFLSEFKEKVSGGYVTKKPPFFGISVTYFTWISNLCRWMIESSTVSDSSPWKDLFSACRTAVRSESGMGVAEFILPLLVLDRLCFGTSEHHVLIRKEFLDVLKKDSQIVMESMETKKAANAVFMTIETLGIWCDREVEQNSRGRSTTGKSRRQTKPIDKDFSPPNERWPAEQAVEKITDFLSSLPFDIQASASASMGMYARSLRCLELHARKKNVVNVFEKSLEEYKKSGSKGGQQRIQSPSSAHLLDHRLIQDVLYHLDDCDTIAALRKGLTFHSPIQQMETIIQEKEAENNFETTLLYYERALQISRSDQERMKFRSGALNCLLELGRNETVLNQVHGILKNTSKCVDLTSLGEARAFGAEAAWKLGRWDELSQLLDGAQGGDKGKDSKMYQLAMGKAMLGLRDRNKTSVLSAIGTARQYVMKDIASVATENYTRSYLHVTRLHSLREVENACELLDQNVSDRVSLVEATTSASTSGWSWDERSEVISPQGASLIFGTRIALARLHEDSLLEGALFLKHGKRAKKQKCWAVAESLIYQAQAALANFPRDESLRDSRWSELLFETNFQLAKIKYEAGETATALKILEYDRLESSIYEMLPTVERPDILSKQANQFESGAPGVLGTGLDTLGNQKELTKRFSNRLLQLTRWTSEIGLKGGSDTIIRFRVIEKLAPSWEKGRFHFGKFIDSLLYARSAVLTAHSARGDTRSPTSEDDIRNQIISADLKCQRYILLAMQQYTAALKIGTKHVYQALPRMLSLWFDLVSLPNGESSSQLSENLLQSQNEANTFMATHIRDIPAAAFYTTMQQIISRVIHSNKETSMVVKSILQRVLIKFPQQAMWMLAWLKGSRNPERATIGEELFTGAEKALAKNHKAMSSMLSVSHSLFRFLSELAVYKGSGERNSSMLQIRPWQSKDVPLSEFVPPIQAALSIAPLGVDQSVRDHFPRDVPRMRAFSSKIGVMSSKAKPKRIRAYAVPASYKPPSQSRGKSRQQSDDIGEIHFLVKQEAKGDLRKDARVQDLNNVINRLMASTEESGIASRNRRRLHLRTFAVTCLSEDVGILEWVPDTDSLRNLVSKSYNPQASASCPRRKGSRLSNFGDPTLRSQYDICQNKYFKEGNLSKAASMFENQCLHPYPPLLYWWFMQRFHDPHAWYEARNRFTLSASAWSAVGHVIGLGDRHSENILVDTRTGECVHVDFDCIFDKGLNLPRPEVVPFRLTANMIDAFGPSGADGVYTAGLETAMRTLRGNRDILLSVLEPFLKDPVIDWKRQRNQQKSSNSPAQDRQSIEAKRSIRVIDERLHGVYNLRNPNLKKYRRTDRSADDEDDMDHLVPLSVEGQVTRMIEEATSSENLVQLYVGWMPWV